MFFLISAMIISTSNSFNSHQIIKRAYNDNTFLNCDVIKGKRAIFTVMNAEKANKNKYRMQLPYNHTICTC